MRNTKFLLTPLPQNAAKGYGRPDRAWAVSFHRTNYQGQLVRARAYFKTKIEAADFCAEKKAEKASMGNLAAGLSDAFKREALACADKLRPYGHTLTEAVDAFVRDLELAGASKTVSETVTHLIAAARASGCSPRHLASLESILGAFTRSFGQAKVSTVRHQAIQAWLEGRKVGGDDAKEKARSISPVSFNTMRRYISLLFSHAVDQDWAVGNPVKKVKPKKVKERSARLLTPEHLRLILEAADDTLRPILAIQALCPVRVAEAAALKWSDILPGGHLRIEASTAKTGKRRTIPLRPSLLRYLLKHRKDSGFIYGGETGASANAMGQQIKLRVRKALPGVPWERNALRASSVSYRLAETQNQASTALEAGHSVSVMESKYKELATPDDALRWFSVDPDSPRGEVIVMPKLKRKKAQ